MLGCPRVLASAHRSGSLSYYTGPQSDHRGLFADIDLRALLGYVIPPSPFPSATIRLLKSGNPALVATYVDSVKSYYDSHQMCDRINHLYNTFQAMPRETVRRKLEAWDADQGRAMIAAEKALRKPPCKYAWSPALRNAGIIRVYWKLQLYDALNSTDHSKRIHRLKCQIRQHDTSFRLPFRDISLPVDEIRKHLVGAIRSLSNIQRAAPAQRTQSHFDLLALYESGESDVSGSEAQRRSTLLRSTIRNEATRRTFSHIGQQLHTMDSSGLQHVNVPRDTLDSPVTPYAYLQRPPLTLYGKKLLIGRQLKNRFSSIIRKVFVLRLPLHWVTALSTMRSHIQVCRRLLRPFAKGIYPRIGRSPNLVCNRFLPPLLFRRLYTVHRQFLLRNLTTTSRKGSNNGVNFSFGSTSWAL